MSGSNHRPVVGAAKLLQPTCFGYSWLLSHRPQKYTPHVHRSRGEHVDSLPYAGHVSRRCQAIAK